MQVTRHQKKLIASKLKAASNLLMDTGNTSLARGVKSLVRTVNAGFNYTFEAVPNNENASQALTGVFTLELSSREHPASGDKGEIIFIVYASSSANEYRTSDSMAIKSLASAYGFDKKFRARVKIYPVEASRASGPRHTLMVAIEPVGVLEDSGSIQVNVEDIAYKRVGSADVGVETAIEQVMSMQNDDKYEIVSIIRPSRYSLVINTADGEGAVLQFNPEAKNTGLRWSCQTIRGTSRITSLTVTDFTRSLDKLLLGD